MMHVHSDIHASWLAGSAAIFAEGAVGEPGVSEIKPYESEEEAVAAVVKLVASKVAAGFIDKSPHTTEPADAGAGAGAGAGAEPDTSADTSVGAVGVQAGYVRLWSLVKEDEPDNLFWRATVSGVCRRCLLNFFQLSPQFPPFARPWLHHSQRRCGLARRLRGQVILFRGRSRRRS